MTACATASRRRSRRRAVVLLAAACGLLLAGCGERFGPGAQAPQDPSTAQAAAEPPPLPPPVSTTPSTPEPSTPATSPTTPGSTPEPTTPVASQLGEVENVGGVIWQPRAIYDGPVQLSVRDGYLAAVVPGSDGNGELRVSGNGDAPAPAAGAGAVPAWGRPHVGTDVSGRTVVTYPRCEDPEAVGTCDIYSWTAATNREVVLRGVSGTALAETEAVMDFGAVLVVREKRPVLSADDLRFDTPPLTTLLLKPRGRPLRVVTRHGGRQIDLRGSRIADVFTSPDPSSENCPDTVARALSLDGLTIAARVVKCEPSSSRTFSAATGPSVADNHLRFAITAAGEPGVALDHDLATGRTRQAKLTAPIEWWTGDGERSGYALDTVGGAGMCSPVEADLLTDARCRIVRSAKLVWKPIDTKWKVGATDQPVRD